VLCRRLQHGGAFVQACEEHRCTPRAKILHLPIHTGARASTTTPPPPPAGSCVVLSGGDELCHADEVRAVCQQVPGIKVVLNPRLFHGAFLLTAARVAVMAEVHALLAGSSAAAAAVAAAAPPVVACTLSAAHSLLTRMDSLTHRCVLVCVCICVCTSSVTLQHRASSTRHARLPRNTHTHTHTHPNRTHTAITG
jgi:hypothetical protein